LGSDSRDAKGGDARGKAGAVTLLLKNNQSKEEQISSLAQIQMTNEEGDKGEEDMMATSCDGQIPPNGLLKCKLVFNFEKTPKELTVALGAGILTKPAYFKVQLGAVK
jgi:hypothetical protein